MEKVIDVEFTVMWSYPCSFVSASRIGSRDCQ